MLNNKGTEAKYNVSIPITGAIGVLGSSDGQSCFAETKLRFEVTGVGASSQIEVQGRLRNSKNWYDIATIPGAVTGTLDISTYDFIRYVVLVVDGSGVLIASGYIFNQATGGGAGGDASASNQVIGNSSLASIDLTTKEKALRVDSSSTAFLYIGEAEIGSLDSSASWKIKKIDLLTGLVTIKFASGNYDQIWDNRASLTYV